jgi:tetratricopeptide (TPR) repeat protein
MSKKIKPYAIVPEELYVTRRADIQLKQIIEDMGRPGYVLVARQMGKTNLLLNAKRYTDSSDDCFAYIDVSNIFSDLRAFFRNIIDTVIFSRDSFVTDLLDELGRTRASTEKLQPHKEHELELKRILDNLPGKLVICLDEIDALTNVDYSDNVFSLIRSIYFGARTQFPQFKRLTYVLSGVADPAELIKNKAVSPFNIGEKIYLEDFTLSETQKFLIQCELDLPDQVVARIYHWTSGNPRVTWDLCSAAENVRNDGGTLDSSGVDSIVNSLYLTNYDIPPFDHIRTRVQSDKELRNAVKAIHHGRSSNLSDKVKDRLYLAGISTPKLESGDVKFKNRIVAESLSAKWIADIEVGLLSLDERAAEKVKLGRYGEALELFRELLELNETSDSKLATRLNIGYCLMHLGDIPSAILEYEECQLEEISNIQLVNAKYHWAGICYLFSERFSDAEFEFRSILNSNDPPRKIKFYPEACINLASVLLVKPLAETDDSKTVSAEIEKLLLCAIELVEQQPSGPAAQDNVLLYTAYYQLARHYAAEDNTKLAINFLDKGLAVSDTDVKSTFLFERAQYESGETQRTEYYQQCAKNIIENKLSLTASDISKILKFGIEECSLLIAKLASLKKIEDARAVFDYVCSVQEQQGIDSWVVIVSSITELIKSQDLSGMPDLAKLSLQCTRRVSAELRHIVTLGILVRPEQLSERDDELFLAYMDYVLSDKNIPLENMDFRVIHDIFSESFYKNDYSFCLKLLELTEAAFERSVSEGSLAEQTIFSGSLILLFLRIRLNIKLETPDQLPSELMPYIHNIWQTEKFSLTQFPDDFAEYLETAFRSMIDQEFFDAKPNDASNVASNIDSIGQNVIVTVEYANGKVRTAKFKKFKNDVLKGFCRITSVG